MKRILYLDDDVNSQNILNAFLQKENWTLYSTSDLDTALKIVKKKSIPIIVIDSKFFQNENLTTHPYSNIIVENDPILIMVGSCISQEYLLKAIKLQVYDFITKPFDLPNFLKIIEKALNYWQSRKESDCLLTVLKEKINELEVFQAEINKEKARLAALVRNMSDAIVLMNSKGKVALINSKAMEIFNITMADNKINYESPNLELVVGKMREALANKLPTNFQITIGETRPSHYNVSINLLTIKNDVEVYTIISNITEIIKSYELRSSLISKLSHELRTPISNIKSATHLLTKKLYPLEDDIKKFFDIIEQEIEHLINDVNSVFDFSYFSSNHIDLNSQSNSLIDLINNILKDLSLKYQNKEIALDIKLPTFIDNFFFDNEKLGKAIKNVLENAFKYTPPKNVIHISAETFQSFASIKSKHYVDGDLPTKAPFALIIIKDSGPGIEPQELKKIFEPFYQAESIFDHQEGTGLGLYICKSIVEAHGGAVWVITKPGKGSTFFIAIPIIGSKEEQRKKTFFKVKT